jgi:hypothetical protein
MIFRKEDYEKSIKDLQEGMTQLEPDGNCCAICGDNDHQAWECHHNPLVHSKRYWKSLTEYRCFHCGQVFTDEKNAEEHFGKRKDEPPLPICSLLCSGYGVFPDGRKCKGCRGCRTK